MKFLSRPVFIFLAAAAMALVGACTKKTADAPVLAKPAKHEHIPPHGGTPVALGKELYHLELVREPSSGKLQAFVFDGELENFIRSSMESIEIVATVQGRAQTLMLRAVPNSATGETVGDTSLFEIQADWLRTTNEFDGILKKITIRGTVFDNVAFSFPRGNDED